MKSNELSDYATWLNDLKTKIYQSRQKAVLAVNSELVHLYWQIGNEILQRQERQGWGAKVVEQLSADLKAEFPDIKGFSVRNLNYMKKFAECWQDFQIVQQLAAQLPWFHNCVILDKLDSQESRLFYMQKTIENGWSRNVLVHQIESSLYDRQGKAVNNFNAHLPEPLSELAIQTLKDPYIFDFIGLSENIQERALEKALIAYISQFLLELGVGFAFVGKQVHLTVGGDDFYVDLLFYHLKMRCYVVVELKTGDFKPEHIGQLNFYLNAVDESYKQEWDNPTIGLLLCKNRNRVVAEYALRGNVKPIGIAKYQLTDQLPDDLKDKLPSVEFLQSTLNTVGEQDAPN